MRPETSVNGSLMAVDGTNSADISRAARRVLSALDGSRRAGISRWDASGVFEELSVAGEEAGRPSARTLLLLYAADLAFRLRWEIRPGLTDGRDVIAAPYVSTAVAFGADAGFESAWLSNLLRFAPRAADHAVVPSAAAHGAPGHDGFVEFARRYGAPVNRPGRMDELRQRVRDRFTGPGRRRGLLVAFEGPDGAGKTTQRKLFKAWLASTGHKVITTKWNSSDLVKPIIKARKALHALSPEEFSLLHAADFRHRLEHEVLPALWDGALVIADRFFFTALARDVARGLDLDWVVNLYQPLLWPDLVFYFSVSPETSSRRVTAVRSPSFYEAGLDVTNVDDPAQSHQQFIRHVIREYESLAVIYDFVTIDAEQSIGEQHQRIRALFLEGARRPWPDGNVDAVAEWLAERQTS